MGAEVASEAGLAPLSFAPIPPWAKPRGHPGDETPGNRQPRSRDVAATATATARPSCPKLNQARARPAPQGSPARHPPASSHHHSSDLSPSPALPRAGRPPGAAPHAGRTASGPRPCRRRRSPPLQAAAAALERPSWPGPRSPRRRSALARRRPRARLLLCVARSGAGRLAKAGGRGRRPRKKEHCARKGPANAAAAAAAAESARGTPPASRRAGQRQQQHQQPQQQQQLHGKSARPARRAGWALPPPPPSPGCGGG